MKIIINNINQIYINTRKSWGNVNPVTKAINSKKIYSRKQKHKSNINENID